MKDNIKCLIVDDESAFLNTLEIMLQDYNSFEIVAKARSVEEAVSAISIYQPQVVFLDIQLGDGTGFDVLKQTKNLNYFVIFVTAFDHYAVEAFRFSAIDYLLKPLASEDLKISLERINHNIQNKILNKQLKALMSNISGQEKKHKKIVLKEHDTHHVIQIDDIIWCAAEGSYTRIYLKNQKDLFVSKHLKEYESLLENYGFLRVHRSHLVNIDKVLRYDKSEGGVLQLVEGFSVPVSIRKKEKLSDILKKL